MSTADPTIPRYAQIARHVRSRILNGELPDGAAIPSETSLVAEFATTRGTVRQAVGLLVQEGLVRRDHGRGTFVQFRPMTHSIWNFGGFTDSVRSRGERPVSEVVEHEVLQEDGGPVLRLVRLRGLESAGGRRMMSLDTSVLSLERFPGLDEVDFTDRSLYETLRTRYGVHPRRTEVALSTAVPDARALELLEAGRPAAALVRLDGHAYDADERIVERIEILYATSVEFKISTVIPEGAGA